MIRAVAVAVASTSPVWSRSSPARNAMDPPRWTTRPVPVIRPGAAGRRKLTFSSRVGANWPSPRVAASDNPEGAQPGSTPGTPGMRSPVSSCRLLILVEQGLERTVPGWVVGDAVLPAVPDHEEPGAGQDADGVGV